MNRFIYLLFPALLLLFSSRAFAQDSLQNREPGNDTDQVIYEDESVDISYHELDPFHPLDSLKGQYGIYGLTTSLLQQQFFGGGIDMQGWYTNNLAVGLSVSIAGRGIRQTFGYSVGEPILMYYDVSLFHECKLVHWKGLEVGARLYAGFSAFHFADDSIKVPTTVVIDGISYDSEEALPVANNYFLRIAPAAVLRYSLSRTLMIESSIAYNFFICHVKFGDRSDFNNYQVQLGLKVNL